MNIPAYNSGQDERDFITINVGGTVYNDYMALTESSFGGNPPANHGRRYNSDDFLGDENDFFEKDYVEIFSKWSNPKTDLSNGGTSNTGIQILNYNPSTHSYTLKIAVDESSILIMPPSKPQNLNLSIVNYHPFLTWNANLETDIAGYYVYRTENSNPAEQIAFIPKSAQRQGYTDTEVSTIVQPDNISYTIKAKDTSSLLSINSDNVSVMGILMKPHLETELKMEKNNYTLTQNYPNPFNPSTVISYSLKEDGIVVIKIFDMLGKEVAVLKNKYETAGKHIVNFNAANLPSGVYFYTINAKDFNKVKKMILLR